MSTSTLSTTDTPLFRGRPPLLVAPAVMVLVLWAKLYPRKHITGKCEEIDAWARPVAQFPLPTLNLCLTIWLYTYSNLDGWPPLAVETPASAESHEATVCQILVASAAFVLTLAQIMSIPVHVKAAWGTQAITKWFWPVMIWPAINGFGIRMVDTIRPGFTGPDLSAVPRGKAAQIRNLHAHLRPADSRSILSNAQGGGWRNESPTPSAAQRGVFAIDSIACSHGPA
ncbi:hypothetical protein PsYK624_040380 [Phanerochaete sordida]|uniref:Uncharacterized protein n=1 Tax=Phanerochaete sordida TaxID=48140 RepID=A0A9P3LAA0_9APHY|nr:hypothetical protein PsYK624_040380 [Phanerochaete sordida]